MKKQIANASRLIRSERELRAGVDGPAVAPAAPALTEAELAQLNADLERLGRRGSRVVEAMRKGRAR
ncbi:MAG: hypothetical protein BWX84_00618 [Verrucomicrobia bacterium ADurb.Bin118]|jgi:hypothetical protein|nr:hypothetical protein [Verrucomicrobiota bacterium]OQB93284.1 MAG: hypothetical protein BWX84_00618 [Verrucomicrobia bacterium ADurb.Bin118]